MLYVVATPIGNLQDITYRAVEVLKSVDLIAAEDTRHTRRLTTHYQIETPLTSYFEHNEHQKGAYLVELLQQGKSVALVSDAGTPGINDPGYALITQVQAAGIEVVVIPGPCALIAALSISGLPTHEFVFAGFLPVKRVARQKRLAELGQRPGTIIVYESPHRLVKTLTDMEEVLHNPYVVCARELTKIHETLHRGSCVELRQHFSNRKVRGECVLLWNNARIVLKTI